MQSSMCKSFINREICIFHLNILSNQRNTNFITDFLLPTKKKKIQCILRVIVQQTYFYLLSFVETPRKFIIAELSVHKLGSLSVLIIPTDEDPSLRIESSAIINLRGVSRKLNKYIVFTMQTYKKLFTKTYFS